jgi:hypothetical protein
MSLLGGNIRAWCNQEGVFFLLWLKSGQGGLLGASKFTPTQEFCAKEADGEGIPL